MPATLEEAKELATPVNSGKTPPLSIFSSSARELIQLHFPQNQNETSFDKSLERSRKALSSCTATLGSKWFLYSLLSLLCWTAWALTAKVGSEQLPASAMQFVSALGFLVVSVAVAAFAKTGSQHSRKGKVYSVISGLLLGTGGLASFAAYRLGNSTATTTSITSLYPAITVGCALVILKERLTRFQIAGLFLSAIAILLFSF